MRFDDRFLDEIKSRVRLSDVIGRTVKLRRQGREFVGLSPFTKEKSPSFFVNDDKGFYHCFSSGKHGDLIGFLQETERLSFPEAVERVAAEAGVPMPAVDPRGIEEEKRRLSLGEWLETAAKWFEAELRRPGGAEARAYLIKRGLPESEWGRFRVGLAPAGRTALKDYLVAKGANPGELVDAGLLISPDDGGAPYDRFRERIIFPIGDARGRLLSFGGRALNPDAKAKYLNGPDTALFDKGRTLYGLAEARKILATAEPNADAPLVVVEGYMDVIACHRAGVAAVAPMGTALTEEQMELMWRFHPEPTLCFDGDAAGQRAAGRSIERALPHLKPGRSFRFAIVSGGKDPDDVLREQGAGALKAQLSETVPFVETLFVRERDKEGLDTPERRAALKNRLRQAAGLIGDKDLAHEYREELMRRFDALFARVAPTQQQMPGRGGRGWRRDPRLPAYMDAPSTPEGKTAARALSRSLEPVPAALAKGAINDPHCLDDHVEDVQSHGFGDPALDDLAQEIVRLRLSADVLDSEALQRHLAARGYSTLLGEIDKAALKSGAPFLVPESSPTLARSHWSLTFAHVLRTSALESEIESAKQNLADRSGMEALERLKSQRDQARRAIREGTIWSGGGS